MYLVPIPSALSCHAPCMCLNVTGRSDFGGSGEDNSQRSLLYSLGNLLILVHYTNTLLFQLSLWDTQSSQHTTPLALITQHVLILTTLCLRSAHDFTLWEGGAFTAATSSSTLRREPATDLMALCTSWPTLSHPQPIEFVLYIPLHYTLDGSLRCPLPCSPDPIQTVPEECNTDSNII